MQRYTRTAPFQKQYPPLPTKKTCKPPLKAFKLMPKTFYCLKHSIIIYFTPALRKKPNEWSRENAWSEVTKQGSSKTMDPIKVLQITLFQSQTKPDGWSEQVKGHNAENWCIKKVSWQITETHTWTPSPENTRCAPMFAVTTTLFVKEGELWCDSKWTTLS